MKSENRNLRRELSRLNKKSKVLEAHFDTEEDDLDDVSKETTHTKNSKKCPSCGNMLEIIDLSVKHLHMCDSCGFRKTFKV